METCTQWMAKLIIARVVSYTHKIFMKSTAGGTVQDRGRAVTGSLPEPSAVRLQGRRRRREARHLLAERQTSRKQQLSNHQTSAQHCVLAA